MKEKLTRNIGLKIISVILAALLWLVITNVEDPIKEKTFFDVPVEILNSGQITDLGQVYEITEGKTINFTISARRSIVDKLAKADFSVTADFSKLSDVNAVAINIRCLTNPSDVTIKSGLQVMKVKLEKLEEKPFKVNVVQKGKPAEGWFVYQKTTNTLLRVSGPKSKIQEIAEIVVEADVTGLTGSFMESEKPKALDSDGKEIDASNLAFSESLIPVTIGMYKTKTVDLNITTNGKPADGYMITKTEYEPKTIVVAASDDILNNLDTLSVSEDISGASDDIEKEVSLQDQLPEGVYLAGDNQTVVVNIKVEKSTTKEIAVLPDTIDAKNKDGSFNLSYITAGPILFKLVGPENEVTNITKENLKPYVDLSNYSRGTYYVGIKADLPDNVTMENNPTIELQLN